MSICSIEDVAEKQQSVLVSIICRDKIYISIGYKAQEAGCNVLQITMDLNILDRDMPMLEMVVVPPKFT